MTKNNAPDEIWRHSQGYWYIWLSEPKSESDIRYTRTSKSDWQIGFDDGVKSQRDADGKLIRELVNMLDGVTLQHTSIINGQSRQQLITRANERLKGEEGK